VSRGTEATQAPHRRLKKSQRNSKKGLTNFPTYDTIRMFPRGTPNQGKENPKKPTRERKPYEE
jgi:hypothetical protein